MSRLYFKSTKLNQTAFEYAKQLTAHHAKSFYLSARFLPSEKRWATYALYGFCRYADNLIDVPRDRSTNELLSELHYLQSELVTGYRTGESQHPIVHPFVLTAKKFKIPIEYPLDLIKGVEMDLQKTRYETFDDLYIFCYRVAGVVGLMMTHLLGYREKSAFIYAEKLGVAMQLTNILRDIKEDKDMGRIYLPQEDLNTFGVTERQLLNEQFDKNFHDMMNFQVNRATEYYMEANKGIPLLATDSQFAIYSASKIYGGILTKIISQNFNPFMGRVYVPGFRKFGILFSEILKTKIMTMQERLLPASS